MVGYVVRKDLKKNNFKGYLLIMLGIVIEILTAFASYRIQIVNGIADRELMFSIVNPYSPNIVIASLLIFSGFSMLKIRFNRLMERIADMSFVIYLFHAGVWNFLTNLIELFKGKDYIINLNAIYWIPAFTVIVFLISVLLTIIYNIFAIKRQFTFNYKGKK